MIAEGDTLSAGLSGHLVHSNDNSEEVTLDALSKGKYLVIFFYPKDMTPGCTVEVQKFRDHYEEIRSLGAEVVGCSKDSEKSHRKFIQKYDLPYSLVSDTEGKILDAFGVWGDKKMYGKTFLGIQRSTFVLKDKKIIKSFPKVDVKKHTEDVVNFLKTLS